MSYDKRYAKYYVGESLGTKLYLLNTQVSIKPLVLPYIATSVNKLDMNVSDYTIFVIETLVEYIPNVCARNGGSLGENKMRSMPVIMINI